MHRQRWGSASPAWRPLTSAGNQLEELGLLRGSARRPEDAAGGGGVRPGGLDPPGVQRAGQRGRIRPGEVRPVRGRNGEGPAWRGRRRGSSAWWAQPNRKVGAGKERCRGRLGPRPSGRSSGFSRGWAWPGEATFGPALGRLALGLTQPGRTSPGSAHLASALFSPEFPKVIL